MQRKIQSCLKERDHQYYESRIHYCILLDTFFKLKQKGVGNIVAKE